MTYACPCTRQITTVAAAAAAARNRVWHFDQAESKRQTPKDNKRNNRTEKQTEGTDKIHLSYGSHIQSCIQCNAMGERVYI